MALHHYHITYFNSKKIYHIPSIEAGAALLKQAFGAPNSQLFVEGLRVKPKTTSTEEVGLDGKVPADTSSVLVPVYLALMALGVNHVQLWLKRTQPASLQTGPDRTLLHDIIACQSTRSMHRTLMQEWCGRARFVVDSINNKCHEEQKPFNSGAQILPIEPIVIQLPTIFPFVSEVIGRIHKFICMMVDVDILTMFAASKISSEILNGDRNVRKHTSYACDLISAQQIVKIAKSPAALYVDLADQIRGGFAVAVLFLNANPELLQPLHDVLHVPPKRKFPVGCP